MSLRRRAVIGRSILVALVLAVASGAGAATDPRGEAGAAAREAAANVVRTAREYRTALEQLLAVELRGGTNGRASTATTSASRSRT